MCCGIALLAVSSVAFGEGGTVEVWVTQENAQLFLSGRVRQRAQAISRRARFSNLPAGTYELSAHTRLRAGHAWFGAAAGVVVEEGESRTLTIEMHSQAAKLVGGTIVARAHPHVEEGSETEVLPIAGLDVVVGDAWTTSDPGGNFELVVPAASDPRLQVFDLGRTASPRTSERRDGFLWVEGESVRCRYVGQGDRARRFARSQITLGRPLEGTLLGHTHTFHSLQGRPWSELNLLWPNERLEWEVRVDESATLRLSRPMKRCLLR